MTCSSYRTKRLDERAKVGAADQSGAINLDRWQVARPQQLVDLRSADVEEDGDLGHAIQKAVLQRFHPYRTSLLGSSYSTARKAVEGVLAITQRRTFLVCTVI